MSEDVDKISIIWCTDDIIWRAHDRRKELTTEQGRAILSIVEHNHDCTIGINWEVIDIWTDEYLAGINK